MTETELLEPVHVARELALSGSRVRELADTGELRPVATARRGESSSRSASDMRSGER